MMNPNILNKNPLMFWGGKCPAQPAAYSHGRCSECRTAADQAAELNETDSVGLPSGRGLERHPCQGRYGWSGSGRNRSERSCPMWWHSLCLPVRLYMFNDPVGMAIYAELHYMMSSLMLGEWFE